jgi:5-methyltetrahydrofolate--homocysteine methyltransferase
MILDGAMGTALQQLHLSECDFRGGLYKQHPVTLLNNFDVLSLTQPEKITQIHNAYLAAGADIITTNTFNANGLMQRKYGLEENVFEMNKAAAQHAAETCREFNKHDTLKHRFVAGSVGPANVMLSLSGNDKETMVEQIKEAYLPQFHGLIEGGADIILIETICDIENAALLLAELKKLMQHYQREMPFVLSAYLNRHYTLRSGAKALDFIDYFSNSGALAIGFNCFLPGLDLSALLRFVKSKSLNTIVCPNAGNPDEKGSWPGISPENFSQFTDCVKMDMLNIIGGCCGTNAAFIKRLAELKKSKKKYH